MVSQVQEKYEFGPFRFDPTEHTLLRGDKVIALTPKAFATLALLDHIKIAFFNYRIAPQPLNQFFLSDQMSATSHLTC